MEIKISTTLILKGLQIISWILFIGLCIHAGSILFNMIYAVTYNPNAALYFGLADLLQTNATHFITIMSLMAIVAVLKAVLFYCIIKVFVEKQLNVTHPFTEAFYTFLNHIAWLSLGIGLFSFWGSKYLKNLSSLNIDLPIDEKLHLSGADVWLLMAIILFVLAQIFKKGIAMQHENEFTI